MNKFVFHIEPATKKNSNQIISAGGRSYVIPSKIYKSFEKKFIKQVREQGLINWQLENFGECSIEVKAVFYCSNKRRRDLSNLLEALADAMEKSTMIVNDYYIQSWDGSRIRFDKENPRIEVEITPMVAEQ